MTQCTVMSDLIVTLLPVLDQRVSLKENPEDFQVEKLVACLPVERSMAVEEMVSRNMNQVNSSWYASQSLLPDRHFFSIVNLQIDSKSSQMLASAQKGRHELGNLYENLCGKNLQNVLKNVKRG